jgi:hypothetical protein
MAKFLVQILQYYFSKCCICFYDVTEMLSRNVEITTARCEITQKSTVLSYFAAEA